MGIDMTGPVEVVGIFPDLAQLANFDAHAFGDLRGLLMPKPATFAWGWISEDVCLGWEVTTP